MRHPLLVAALAFAGTPQLPVFAAETTDVLDQVTVYGRGERLVGAAQAASEGTVGGADLGVRPLLRVAELLEVVPGLIAAQHSGSGKANQYFLRGFNLDHGTDFAAYIDEVPLNLRTHGHGQGYLDINGLIPETVDRIDFRKGPYRADLGDNALAGASFLNTVSRFESPFVSLEAGGYGWQRIAAGGSTDLGPGELSLVGQWKTYDGPWQLPEDLQHFSAFTKYSQPTGFGHLEASYSIYDASWHPTEQIPERAIGSAICADAFCALDTSATGNTERHIATLRLVGDDWRATFYSQFYNWNMYSDATYGYQIRQWDRRLVHGARAQKIFRLNSTLEITGGAEARYDDIRKVQVDHTAQRTFVDFVAAHKAQELSLAGFAEASWHATDSLRLMAGARADYFDFQTTPTQAGFAGGKKHDSVASPKLAAAWQVTQNVEAYANWGRGYHSNDARGVTAFEPPVAGLISGEGREIGGRYQRGPFSFTATYWWLKVDSELKFVGDSNSVEPGAASSRRGYELVSFWRPIPQLAIDATWTASHARYFGADAVAGETHIAGAIESAGELGVSFIRGPWELSGRLRHLGPYPLTEDDAQRAQAENVVNLRAAWKFGDWMLYGELLNVFDGKGKDIVYWYEAELPAIDPPLSPGVDACSVRNCRMSRSEEPRTVRLGVRYRF